MMRPRKVIAIAVLALLIIGIALSSNLRPQTAQTPTPSATGAGIRGLIVEPDDGRRPILDEIESADVSIDLMIYLLTDDRVIDSLIEAERRGVDVRILLEHDPFGGYGDPADVADEMRRAGAEVKWTRSNFTFTHAKTMIVDRKMVAILNFNLSRSSFETNREFGVISTWPGDVQDFQGIFDADWDGKSTRDHGPLVTSPDNSRNELTALIDSAEQSIEIYAEVVRDRDILDELERAEERGVDVRIVISPDEDPNAARVAIELESAGVEIRYLSDLYVHAKAIVVDGERVFIGSQNLTQTSLDQNREVGVIVNEIEVVARLMKVFERDFAISSSSS